MDISSISPQLKKKKSPNYFDLLLNGFSVDLNIVGVAA